MKRCVFLLLACVVLAATVRADEIRLKNGSKIIGTIVGFENGAFKIETDFGSALVRKDSIAEIVPGAPKEPVATLAPAATPPAPAQPAAAHPETQIPPILAAAGVAVPPRMPSRLLKLVPPPAVKPSAPEPIPAAMAPPAPEPPTMREWVRGNLYVNQTYGLEMYRPPGWVLIEDAKQALPNAIAALGKTDETALLVIGRESGRGAHDSLDAHAAATDHALRNIYENYRLASSSRTNVAGLLAVEQRAHGMVGGRDWSVIVITFRRQNAIFTILAMAYSNSDLIQIQENVIGKMIATLRFNAAH